MVFGEALHSALSKLADGFVGARLSEQPGLVKHLLQRKIGHGAKENEAGTAETATESPGKKPEKKKEYGSDLVLHNSVTGKEDTYADVLRSYDRVLVPEMNLGQLSVLVRSQYLVDATTLSKVQGLPFRASEIEAAMLELLEGATT